MLNRYRHWTTIRQLNLKIVFIIAAVLTLRSSAKELKVGLLFVKETPGLMEYVAYQNTAAAVTFAASRLHQENCLTDYNFTFIWYFDECEQTASIGYATKLMFEHNVDVIIGPTCANSGKLIGYLGRYYNFPVILWGLAMPTELTVQASFPTVSVNAPVDYQVVISLFTFLYTNDWHEFALLYEADKGTKRARCSYIAADMDRILPQVPEITMVYSELLVSTDSATLRTALNTVNSRARIVVFCTNNRRAILKAIMDNNMNTNDFVFIFLETRCQGFGDPAIWVEDSNGQTDGLDYDLRLVASRVLIIDILVEGYRNRSFLNAVRNSMSKPPFNCTTECEGYEATATSRSFYLADAMYTYGLAQCKLLANNSGHITRDGQALVGALFGTYKGYAGEVRIDNTGNRNSIYGLYGLDENLEEILFATMENNKTDVQWYPRDEYEKIWANWGGEKPLEKPKCGYDGSGCSTRATTYKYIVSFGTVIIVVGIISLGIITAAIIRNRLREKRLLDESWKLITYHSLLKPNSADKLSPSQRSLHSNNSSMTLSNCTLKLPDIPDDYEYFRYGREMVVAVKHIVRPKITKDDADVLRFMRQQYHDNLNTFLGLCIDGPQYLSIWRHCSRGSLQNLIQKQSVNIDTFFTFSIMRDICEGLCFIHNSILEYHGHLTSACCFLDERWQVKISEYGPQFIKGLEQRRERTLLWTAPEHLRSGGGTGSKKGDIYSFAIISSEIVTKMPAFNIIPGHPDESLEEVILKVKRKGCKSYRPQLIVDRSLNLSPAVLQLIRQCWDENPAARPDAKVVKKVLHSMGFSCSLMDHMFTLLEENALNLESEVKQRTQELIEEQERSDKLLYRMLPRQVAEKLKCGQTVVPESFEAVTIFFSDVVRFTDLAKKCTPVQVIELLNNLYTVLDAVIEECEVYKVETIGDGYLCVSGLPHRNGNEHAREVAELAFLFLRSIKSFKVPHLPDEQIRIRIGIHTGPVVAGIIGQTLPRYCLFGDAVNTASRMESNGEANRIHISPDTNKYLTEIIGGYITVCRGEIPIKGKGIMKTYWLIPPGEPETL